MIRLNAIFFVLFLLCVGHNASAASAISSAGAESPLEFVTVGEGKDTERYRLGKNIMDEVSKRTGIEMGLKVFPPKRALSALTDGKFDGDWARIDGFDKKIPGLIKVLEPIASQALTAYSTRDDIAVDGWKSLEPYRVVYPLGSLIVEYHLKPFHKKLTTSANISSGLSMVAADRADVYIHVPFIIDKYLNKRRSKYKKIRALSPPLGVVHFYVFMREKHEEKAVLISDALKSMKEDGAYSKIRGW
jgi:ABC-type amino acid transport substrate-binding protein